MPDAITVQELANRMAERAADVIKKLMELGVMATINQVIDADTAELVTGEFGHKVRRVSESDVETGLQVDVDPEESKELRADGHNYGACRPRKNLSFRCHAKNRCCNW